MARVLVVDDDEGVRTFLADALSLDGHDVAQAPGGEIALRLLDKRAVHVLITDLKMPGIDGLELLRRTREAHPEIEVIVLTAHGSIDSAVEAMRRGAFDYLQKPIGSPAELRALVGRAFERHRLRARVEADAADAPVLSWGAPSMRPVVEALERVAPTEATVLLLGESGVGKEVAATFVHRRSRRASGPLVAQNCAALSDTLLESELFGHERGAFTGAVQRRRGRIELAEGGSFFLDEVGELKADLQARLLRVLQERRFERVGGAQTIEADVRWIAATNRDLGPMVADGRFREDLYWRLAVFPIVLPPLRDRLDDVVPLARALLVRVSRSLGRVLALGADAEAALVRHAWPGNVRELANTLERAAILARGDVLRADDFALLIRPAASASAVPTLEEAEREAIRRALELHGGNRRKAAEHLGIGERTLYDKLKRYDLG